MKHESWILFKVLLLISASLGIVVWLELATYLFASLVKFLNFWFLCLSSIPQSSRGVLSFSLYYLYTELVGKWFCFSKTFKKSNLLKKLGLFLFIPNGATLLLELFQTFGWPVWVFRSLELTQAKGLGESMKNKIISLSEKMACVEGSFVMCLSQAEA
jgi:hypothetical protein